MMQIKRFGHWLWFHWFIREDGAWLIRLHLPGKRAYTVYGGLNVPTPRRVAGFFYEANASHALMVIVRIPGRTYTLRYALAYIEPSDRFRRWMYAMAR